MELKTKANLQIIILSILLIGLNTTAIFLAGFYWKEDRGYFFLAIEFFCLEIISFLILYLSFKRKK